MDRRGTDRRREQVQSVPSGASVVPSPVQSCPTVTGGAATPKEDETHGDPLQWLLETDVENPGVRFYALRDLLGRPPDDLELAAAQAGVMRTGPVPVILNAQAEAGYWVKPGPGYSPKYRSTVWSLMFLAQFGADGHDERVQKGIDYLLTHARLENGAFSCNGRADQVVHCLWGNLVRTLLDLGCWGDPRLDVSIDHLARSITGDGYGSYHRTRGLLGPRFACAYSDGLPCTWGAVRAFWALTRVPEAARTPAVNAAIEASADFLLSHSVRQADYPHSRFISPRWFEFGYPLAYAADVLLNLEALIAAGYRKAPKVIEALEWARSKQDADGRWKLEHTYRDKMWVEVEEKGKPSKWVTLRALRVLRAAEAVAA